MKEHPEAGDPEAVAPPVIDPEHWDEREGFRETFLANVTHSRHNAALRGLGGMLRELTSETVRLFYQPPEGDLVHRLRGVVADLRYLEGYLKVLGDYNAGSDEEEELCRQAWRRSSSLKKCADALEDLLPARNGKNAGKTKKTKKKGAR